jgi:hypothetical protein
MNHIALSQFSEQIFRDTAFGLGFLAIVLFVNVFLFMQIFFWFMRSCGKIVTVSPYTLIARFMGAILMMCLTQLASILMWTAVLHLNGLIDDVTKAMLFAGSCYTTLGVYADILPHGWKLVAFYIAFSGLFSFAIATSAMMSMLSLISKRIYEEESASSPTPQKRP